MIPQDEFAGHGGSYTVDGSGNRVLVEGTRAQLTAQEVIDGWYDDAADGKRKQKKPAKADPAPAAEGADAAPAKKR